ncbi:MULTISPECIES: group III truncated hemoglobin [unclassified Xanthomonas]|nr:MULTISPECIES: group III truncated hemoglobin [unclassified Xanthomonas]MDY4298261.1 group III truncated hemoglobin [Xanthomonas sp. LF02-5]MDY4360052.1 group III truncated hemoglobin [Xanthomonas sp. LF04-12]
MPAVPTLILIKAAAVAAWRLSASSDVERTMQDQIEGMPLPGPDLCSEAEVQALVETFYRRVRADADLSAVFAAHIEDWDAHQQQLCDFWSAMLRGTRRFRGAPMPRHMAMRELSALLFQRWLGLFRATTAELPNMPMRLLADDIAQRIAETFWRRHQMSWRPFEPASPLPPAACAD